MMIMMILIGCFSWFAMTCLEVSLISGRTPVTLSRCSATLQWLDITRTSWGFLGPRAVPAEMQYVPVNDPAEGLSYMMCLAGNWWFLTNQLMNIDDSISLSRFFGWISLIAQLHPMFEPNWCNIVYFQPDAQGFRLHPGAPTARATASTGSSRTFCGTWKAANAPVDSHLPGIWRCLRGGAILARHVPRFLRKSMVPPTESQA